LKKPKKPLLATGSTGHANDLGTKDSNGNEIYVYDKNLPDPVVIQPLTRNSINVSTPAPTPAPGPTIIPTPRPTPTGFTGSYPSSNSGAFSNSHSGTVTDSDKFKPAYAGSHLSSLIVIQH
jgi:hypothetical protein